jgi:hypothetical protein
MREYFELYIVIVADLLVSCAGEGFYGWQGPCGWGPMRHYGFA